MQDRSDFWYGSAWRRSDFDRDRVSPRECVPFHRPGVQVEELGTPETRRDPSAAQVDQNGDKRFLRGIFGGMNVTQQGHGVTDGHILYARARDG